MILRAENAPSEYADIVAHIDEGRIVARMWQGDYTVWEDVPDEITNRLAWIRLPETMPRELARLHAWVDSVQRDRFTNAVLLGMGGSSLAPDMFAKIVGPKEGYSRLRVLDSTHPQTVLQVSDATNEQKTLFLVATKSGTTTETLSLFRYFHQRVSDRVPHGAAGDRFVAITDPHTPLAETAARDRFRDVFLNDPNVGGRYSALSLFGLVPAALLGMDVDAVLGSARTVAHQCSPETASERNPAVTLGAFLGSCALAGRDKATLLLSEGLEPFGDWVEQLIAESSGKEGHGIVPVLERSLGEMRSYGDDRLFILVGPDADPRLDRTSERIVGEGWPVVRLLMSGPQDLGAHCYLWEHAIAIACHALGVHPFNQPNVESAKRFAAHAAETSRRTGATPSLDLKPISSQAIASFLSDLAPGDYVGLQAYLPESEDLTASLENLQTALRDRYKIAVTVGYGPRFLHSTGQLHKGDRGNGRFLQLLSDHMPVVPIPDSLDDSSSSFSFGSLITSQAYGDRRALEAGHRPVRTFEIPDPAPEAILTVAEQLTRA